MKRHIRQCVVLATLLPLGAAGIAQAALIGQWNFEGNGLDSSSGWTPTWSPGTPAPNNGLVRGTVSYVAGPQGQAIRLNNTSAVQQYVQLTGTGTVNAATNLGLQKYTVSAWINSTGLGTTANSGSGGANRAIPLVCKGVGEGDASNLDANYFFGINKTTSGFTAGVLCADFETYLATSPANPNGGSGTNFPVFGKTVVTDGKWHHVAATWDGQFWNLYVDGNLDASRDWSTLTSGQVQTKYTSPAPVVLPRYDSIQWAAIGAALGSAGLTGGAASNVGGYTGDIDDVRLYDAALTGGQVAALVPEPASLGMLALGAVALLARRRR